MNRRVLCCIWTEDDGEEHCRNVFSFLFLQEERKEGYQSREDVATIFLGVPTLHDTPICNTRRVAAVMATRTCAASAFADFVW